MPLDDARRQLAPHPVERSPARAVLEPRDRRLRRQGRAGHRVSPEQQLVDRVIGQVVGIVAIGMSARDAEDPLADQVLTRVPNLPRCASVGQTPGERRDHAVHPLRRLEQDGTAIGTRLLAVERGDEGRVEQIGKQDSPWYRLRCHAGVSIVVKRL